MCGQGNQKIDCQTEDTMYALIISVLTTIFIGSFCTQSRAEEAERPARTAQCFLEIEGVRHAGGNCQFTLLDGLGSFRIEFEKGLSAQVRVETRSTEYVDKQH